MSQPLTLPAFLLVWESRAGNFQCYETVVTLDANILDPGNQFLA